MKPTVLVLGAGTGTANNLVTGLRAALPGLLTIGAHHDVFTLRRSSVDRKYLLSPFDLDPREIGAIAAAEGVDVVMATSEADVTCLSEGRDAIPARVFLPSKAVIRLCQDKYDLASFLAQHGIPAPRSVAVPSLEAIDDLFDGFGGASPLWCRARHGSGSRAAAPVADAHQARAWIEHWQSLRDTPPSAFMLADYLPGREFFCQSLWQDGRLVQIMTCEALSHLGSANSLSGTSSLFSLAKTLIEERVKETSIRALRALDPSLTGAYSLDLKENVDGVPCVTEINAGRISMGMTTIGELARHSMSACFVRLAMGEELYLEDPYDCPPDYYIVRDIDAVTEAFHADTVLDGIKRVTC